MIPIFSLLLIISISIIITRVATIALTHTGLSRESARFQARSAFTGSGFTTAESERVVSHPVRRRIIMLLMLLGNAGLVTAVSSLILTFVGQQPDTPTVLRIGVLAMGLLVLWLLARSHWVDKHLCRLIDWALKRYTQLDVNDYASLMHLAGEYRIVELQVEEGDWLANKSLAEARLWDEGMLVLGIQRTDGTYLGAPKGEMRVLPQDTLVLYGRVSALEELDRRRCDRSGELEHKQAVAEQERIIQQEKEIDPATD